jgi:inhibitor of cysteine peptidase
MAQSSSTATSSSSILSDGAEVRIGGLVFEIGSHLALEIFAAKSSSCRASSVAVEGMELIDAAGNSLRSEAYSPALDASNWIGRVELVDDEGDPLPSGRYEIVVTTDIARFVASLETIDESAFRGIGRYAAEASVCGFSLRVYRLLTEADATTRALMRVGDRLMVLLEGNPTTGYQWTNTLEYEYAVLRETQEAEFRATSGLIGAGGVFIFRFHAVDVGPQAFRFAYQRPWESVQPIQTVILDTEIR